MIVLSLLLGAAAYGAFYAAAPGRQSKALGSTRPLLWAGSALTVAALALSIVATESAVGPALVVTVMMAVASVLAVAGPFFLPEAVQAERRASVSASGRTPKRPPTRPPSTS